MLVKVCMVKLYDVRRSLVDVSICWFQQIFAFEKLLDLKTLKVKQNLAIKHFSFPWFSKKTNFVVKSKLSPVQIGLS